MRHWKRLGPPVAQTKIFIGENTLMYPPVDDDDYDDYTEAPEPSSNEYSDDERDFYGVSPLWPV